MSSAIKMPSQRIFSSALAFVSAFFLTFSGDYVVAGVYLVFVFALALMAFRMIYWLRLVSFELIATMSMAFLFLVVMFVNSSDVSSYYISFSFACLFALSIRIFIELQERSEVAYFCVFILLAMLPIAVFALVRGDVRSSILFGPNVYYRVAGFLFVFFLLVTIVTDSAKWLRFPALAVSSAVLLSTGSRGAVPILGLIVLLYLKATLRLTGSGVAKILVGLSALVVVALQYLEVIQERLWRLTFFDLENASLQTRTDFLAEAIQYTHDVGLKQFLFGDGESRRIFSYYPHNVLVEAFVFHGVAVLGIFVAYGALLLYAIIKPLDGADINSNLVLLFGPIYIGSMFSGSFFESYPVAAVSVFVTVRLLLKAKPVPRSNFKQLWS